MYSYVPARALFLHDSYLRCVQVWEHLKGRETQPKEILKPCSFDVKGLPLCCIKVWFKLCLLVLQALFTFQLGRMSGSFFNFVVCEQITFSPSAPWEQKLCERLNVFEGLHAYTGWSWFSHKTYGTYGTYTSLQLLVLSMNQRETTEFRTKPDVHYALSHPAKEVKLRSIKSLMSM